MHMYLDNSYKVETDANNFVLVYEEIKFNKNTKKEYVFKEEWYFPKLSLALDEYMNECMKPLSTVSEALLELNRIETLIKSIK